MVKLPDDVPFPFHGRVVWLTPEQGGRASATRADATIDYAANAYVRPHADGCASFVLRGFDSQAWTSRAVGRWLILPNTGPQRIESGTVVVVTEGPIKSVGYFHVDHVDPSPT